VSKKTTAAPRMGRKEAMRLEHQKRKTQRMILIGALVSIFVIALAVLIYLRFGQPDVEGVTRFGTQSQVHDAQASLPAGPRPPVGGAHFSNWQNCGVYREPIQSEYAVHSMEHGAVWLTYQPDLPAAELANLENLVRGQSYVLMSPYPDQDSPVVMTAWGMQMAVESLPDDRINQFIRRYRQGSQTPEPGAPCTGGVGTPLN
jgi:hypothetical protein